MPNYVAVHDAAEGTTKRGFVIDEPTTIGGLGALSVETVVLEAKNAVYRLDLTEVPPVIHRASNGKSESRTMAGDWWNVEVGEGSVSFQSLGRNGDVITSSTEPIASATAVWDETAWVLEASYVHSNAMARYRGAAGELPSREFSELW